jgi:hypothetical protein
VLKRQSDGSWKGVMVCNDRGRTQFSDGKEPKLLQLRVLRFRSDEDRNIRVGIFPEREEILIGRLGLGGVALHGIGPADLEMRECVDGFVRDHSAMVEDFLEFCCGFAASSLCNQVAF